MSYQTRLVQVTVTRHKHTCIFIAVKVSESDREFLLWLEERHLTILIGSLGSSPLYVGHQTGRMPCGDPMSDGPREGFMDLGPA